MELLLILSAMLSAVTGAFSGGRAPEVRPQQVAVVQAEAPRAARVQQLARLDAPVPRAMPRLAPVFTAPAIALPAGIPLYADRLIE